MKSLKTTLAQAIVFPPVAPPAPPAFESCREFLRQVQSSRRVASKACEPVTLGTQSAQVQSSIDFLLAQTSIIDCTTLEDLKRNGLLNQLPRYLGTVGTRIEQLQGLFEMKDFSEVSSVLHALVNPTNMLGAFALSAYVQSLDIEVKCSGRWPCDKLWLQTLERLYDLTFEAVRPHLTMN